MSKINFDEETHTYTDDNGVVKPSVTQVLPQPSENIMYTSRFWEKTELGSRVHKACEIINTVGYLKDEDYGTLKLQDCDIPYIDAWVKFLDDNPEMDILHAEMKVVSKNHEFAGTLDLTVSDSGIKSIIDIKTVSVVSPTTALQLAGYIIAYNEMTGKDIYHRQCVQLKPDSTYRRIKYPVTQLNYDKSIFLSKLTSYRWDLNNNINK